MKRISSTSRRGVLAASTVSAFGVVLMAAPLLATSASATPPNADHKVTICHRDNSDSKPYVIETVDIASTGYLKAGHDGHTGDVWAPGMKADHDKWGDIIPSYDYTKADNTVFHYAGLNWTDAGKAIYDNGCKVVAPTPSESSSSAAPEPSQSSSAPVPNVSTSAPAPNESTSAPAPVSSSDPGANGGPQGDPQPNGTTVTTPTTTTKTTTTKTTTTTTTSSAALAKTGSTLSTLPKTGSNTGLLSALGAALVGLGALGMIAGRRRTEVEAG